MAKSQPPREKESGRADDGNLLEMLLAGVENFVAQISELAVEAAPQGEHQVLIRSTGESVVGQTRRLLAFTREMAGRLAAPQREELNGFLRVQDGEAIAARGVAVAQQQLRAGVAGRLIHWISQHLKELKKILWEILEIISKLLHFTLPDWLPRIFQLLDELFDLLASLLGEVFGLDFARTSRELSEREVNFLREMAAVASLKAAQAGLKLSNQDES